MRHVNGCKEKNCRECKTSETKDINGVIRFFKKNSMAIKGFEKNSNIMPGEIIIKINRKHFRFTAACFGYKYKTSNSNGDLKCCQCKVESPHGFMTKYFLIDYLVDEAYEAGIHNFIFSGMNKSTIKEMIRNA